MPAYGPRNDGLWSKLGIVLIVFHTILVAIFLWIHRMLRGEG